MSINLFPKPSTYRSPTLWSQWMTSVRNKWKSSTIFGILRPATFWIRSAWTIPIWPTTTWWSSLRWSFGFAYATSSWNRDWSWNWVKYQWDVCRLIESFRFETSRTFVAPGLQLRNLKLDRTLPVALSLSLSLRIPVALFSRSDFLLKTTRDAREC